MPITLNGDTGIQTPMYNGTITANAVTPVTGFKNRIINGQMTFDQRNAGASITANDNTYAVDRWVLYASQSSKLTAQQNQGSVTPPAGFRNYLGYTSSSAYTVGSSEQFTLTQPIEGFNVADLAWGTASAATVTLSFWVRSSLTGTFGGALRNAANNRTYPFSYTITSANTWEQKSITIAGDTSGTWVTTNGYGLGVGFNLGAGSSVSGTAGSWSSSGFASATGATSVVGTNGATFYITGVQLEVGSTATSFDYRPYGTELALCQRYYENVSISGTILSTVQVRPDGYRQAFYSSKQTMRAAPTSTFTWDGDTSGVNAGTPATTVSFFYVWSASAIASGGVNPRLTALSLSAEL